MIKNSIQLKNNDKIKIIKKSGDKKMIPKTNITLTTEETYLPKEQYDEIKKSYLCRKENTSILYRKYCEKYNIEKKVFIEILNMIRKEACLPIDPLNKKVKRMHNPYSFHDKHPNAYNVPNYHSIEYKGNESKNNGKKINKVNKRARLQSVTLLN